MTQLLDELPADARRKTMPEWTAPMLAVLTEQRFSDSGWLYERKLDGERCLVFRHSDDVRLVSRTRKDLDDHYPELVEAVAAQTTEDFVADGEIVAFDGNKTSFARLQRRMQISDPNAARHTGVAVYLYLFDLLHVDGYDLARVELRRRKTLLRRLLEYRDPLRYTAHRLGEGVEYWRQACRRGWEGVIAKRADGRYVHGRSGDWLKFKCVAEQEFVIGGYTEPSGSRIGFGALLVGYYENSEFMYAGKVGTGYDQATLRRLRRKLESWERQQSPFTGVVPDRGVHWVKPRLVCQVAFTEWTQDGQLRHPRYLGLRDDKGPHDVRKERPTRPT